MNTKISYLYRDVSNYKVPNECIVRGLLTDEQTKAILDCLDRDNFIPSQVGLPERRFDRFDPEEDTCWFELYESGFDPTDAEATVDLSVDELVSRFLARKDRWDDTVIPRTGKAGPREGKSGRTDPHGHGAGSQAALRRRQAESRPHPRPLIFSSHKHHHERR